jgi:hypothetical protein
MQVMGRGLSGKKGGKIEFIYQGKEGPGTMFLTPPAMRSMGSRGSLRMNPSQLWHHTPQFRR